MSVLTQIFNQELFISMIRLSTPITLAAVGAAICERSGIVNIAMEGIMIIGAFFASLVAYKTGNPWMGMMAGIIAGGIFSMIHAAATVTFHLDHTVSGAVLNILAFGFARYFLVLFYGHPGSSEPIMTTLADKAIDFGSLKDIPYIGRILFDQTPIVYISIITVFLLYFLLFKTKFGLHVRASGEHPLALETLGVSVIKVRYWAVIISGLTAGLAGAYLSIENTNIFTEGMSNGRGFIALAANISGGWNPIGVWIASLFFGFADAIQYRFQLIKTLSVPSEFFIIFPYVATIIAVAGLVKKSRPPKASGLDYIIEKEED